jgi:hypothetical protein
VRNLKDDIILSLFMMLAAVIDRSIIRIHDDAKLPMRKTVWAWVFAGLLLWLLSSFRFYLALAIVTSLAINSILGRGMKLLYRATFAAAIAVGFVGFTMTSAFEMVEEKGGAGAVAGSASNIAGLFKVFVTPLPWQHVNSFLALPHTFYLFLLVPALWSFFAKLPRTLDWKLFVVLQVALVVGGMMEDFEPRKRYIMYPVFLGWVLLPKRKKAVQTKTEEPFDPNVYFAQPGHVYS